MTKISIKKTQKLVDRFLPEIKINLNLSLEDVVVIKDELIKDLIIMHAYPKKIGVNPDINYKPLPNYDGLDNTFLEYCVLHELSHVVQLHLNPRMNTHFAGKMLGYKFGSRRTEWLALAELYHIVADSGKYLDKVKVRALQEGFAEFLSIDILPQFCSVSKPLKEFVYERKYDHLEDVAQSSFHNYDNMVGAFVLDKLKYLPKAEGYNFFSKINQRIGLVGVFDYVKNIQNYQVPEYVDILFPRKFIQYLASSQH